MRGDLEIFLAGIPDSEAALHKHAEAVAEFGYFLEEIQRDEITPAAYRECYAAARLRPPRSIPDTISKSGSFFRNGNGWTLHRGVVNLIKSELTPIVVVNRTNEVSDRSNVVM